MPRQSTPTAPPYNGLRQLFINNRGQRAADGGNLTVSSPYTQAPWTTVAAAQDVDVHRAVKAAHAAWQTWRQSSAGQREALLLKFAHLLEEHQAELAETLVWEAGQTPTFAAREVAGTAALARVAAGAAWRVQGQTVPSSRGKTVLVLPQPLGVIGIIKPWNLPLQLTMISALPALAAGNTIVLKPAEETPLTVLQAAQLMAQAGFPPGVVNVVPGLGTTAGAALVQHPLVSKIAFTGSSAVGREIGRQAAGQMKPFTLETSGKDALIVCRDADLQQAATGCTHGGFLHSGQICMGTKRVLVEAPVYDEFVQLLVERVSKLRGAGQPAANSDYGPLINEEQRDKIHRQVTTARQQGARVLTGGHYDGLLYAPTVLTDVTPAMAVYREESFGPLQIVVKVDDLQQAVSVWNETDFGLSGGLYTNDLNNIMYTIEHAQCGMLHVNDQTINFEPMAPFGGVKDSGLGRATVGQTVDTFTQTKVVTLQPGS